MKVVDVQSFQAGTKAIEQAISPIDEQLKALQLSIKHLTSLQNELKGQTGNGIRTYFKTVHDPFLTYLHHTLTTYKKTLTTITKSLQHVETNPQGHIRTSFLQHDLLQGLSRSQLDAHSLIDNVNNALSNVSHIVDVRKLNEVHISDAISQAKQAILTTLTDVTEFDQTSEKALKTIEHELTTLTNYLQKMSNAYNKNSDEVLGSLAGNKDLFTRFKPESLAKEGAYRRLTGELFQKGTTKPVKTLHLNGNDYQVFPDGTIVKVTRKGGITEYEWVTELPEMNNEDTEEDVLDTVKGWGHAIWDKASAVVDYTKDKAVTIWQGNAAIVKNPVFYAELFLLGYKINKGFKDGVLNTVKGIGEGALGLGEGVVHVLYELGLDRGYLAKKTVGFIENVIYHPEKIRNKVIDWAEHVRRSIEQAYERDVVNGDAESRTRFFTEGALNLATFLFGGEVLGGSRAVSLASKAKAASNATSKVTKSIPKVHIVTTPEGLSLPFNTLNNPLGQLMFFRGRGTGEMVKNIGDINDPIRTYRGADLVKLEAKYTADPRLTVEMPYVGKGQKNTNAEGWLRDKDFYWKEMLKKYPEAFSKSNRQKIELGFSPINNTKFRKHFPQYDLKELYNDTLIHHHIGGGGQAVAVPSKLHPGLGGIHNAEKSSGVWGNDQKYADLLEKFLEK
ncbi:hypothetical protein A374_06241 [Fictibacillus macauensis ZFHKF-1]|uniref:LXG domain-containing protein n=1 Tax=Fictibacillus macauensis ZFHKF-1 TaxID=1196324 RepID=I8J343_9BACL|nr:T7SS effector LXG polymorphic toxin [Fictibacillus macauensis]EIT86176.1 hypothetical protein A374_06241 [Fictibacillus macauensis ZFHKF-1]